MCPQECGHGTLRACATSPACHNAHMQEVNVGIVGLGNVGSGTIAILAGNAEQIALKLGFRLKVAAVCSRSVAAKSIPESLGLVFRTADWREVFGADADEFFHAWSVAHFVGQVAAAGK